MEPHCSSRRKKKDSQGPACTNLQRERVGNPMFDPDLGERFGLEIFAEFSLPLGQTLVLLVEMDLILET